MKIIYQKDNEFKFIPETFEDLFHLKLFINPKDIVESTTTRKIKAEDSKNVKIKTVFVSLEVEKIELKKDSNELKVLGKILKSSEEISGYHSIHIELNSEFKLIKNTPINQYILNKISNPTNKNVYLGCVFDNHEAIIFELSNTKINVLENVILDNNFDENEKRFRDLFSLIKEYYEKKRYFKLLLGFSIFWKNTVDQILVDFPFKDSVVYININNPTLNGIHELIRSEEMKNLLKDVQIREEEIIINEFMKRLKMNDKVEYGEKVKDIVETGAIEVLILSEDYLLENFEAFKLIEALEQKNGKFIVIETEDAKKVINNFGKMVAFLRYNIY
ncbi:MAG: hypothetical protein QXR30_00440 [Candidatus Woesearchaeota archaeon]